jgi:hypothetical protein
MSIFSNQKNPKKTPNFFCEKCNFISFNKKDYTRHLETKKHKSNHIGGFSNTKNPKKTPHDYSCACGKIYKDNSGLWRHKKKCEFAQIINNEYNNDKELLYDSELVDKELLIKYLMKENTEFKDMLMEQNKAVLKVCEKTTSSINNSNINSNNKMFNLNVFLNEECKDAMNIMDFVNSLNINLSDLESVGKLGYVEGISSIIVKNLKALDIKKRPVHCSDSKREILYVKDENKWEKDNIEKNKLRKVIKHVAHKNSRILPEFKAKYPDCIYSESRKSNQYNKIIIETMGGSGDDDNIKENKIIKNIAKEVIIEK